MGRMNTDRTRGYCPPSYPCLSSSSVLIGVPPHRALGRHEQSRVCLSSFACGSGSPRARTGVLCRRHTPDCSAWHCERRAGTSVDTCKGGRVRDGRGPRPKWVRLVKHIDGGASFLSRQKDGRRVVKAPRGRASPISIVACALRKRFAQTVGSPALAERGDAGLAAG